MSQTTIRNNIRDQRNLLSDHAVLKAGKHFAQSLEKHPLFITSQHIALYWSCQNEVDMRASIDLCHARNKNCYLPVVMAGKLLGFAAYTPNTMMHTNTLGIMEPIQPTLIPPEALDMVIVPSIAIDMRGNRIGMGAGYYDRTFAFITETKKPLLIAAIYPFQLVDAITPHAHDVPCHDVIIASLGI